MEESGSLDKLPFKQAKARKELMHWMCWQGCVYTSAWMGYQCEPSICSVLWEWCVRSRRLYISLEALLRRNVWHTIPDIQHTYRAYTSGWHWESYYSTVLPILESKWAATQTVIAHHGFVRAYYFNKNIKSIQSNSNLQWQKNVQYCAKILVTCK